MDIDSIGTVNEDDGVFVHFKDAAGELLYDGDGEKATPVGATVCGTYSSQFRAAMRALAKVGAARQRRGEKPDDATIEKDQRTLEAACIRSWTFVQGGKPAPVTADLWALLAKKQPQWAEQVAVAMQAHELFSPAS